MATKRGLILFGEQLFFSFYLNNKNVLWSPRSNVILKFHNSSQHTTVDPLSIAASLTPEEDSTLFVAFLAYPFKFAELSNTVLLIGMKENSKWTTFPDLFIPIRKDGDKWKTCNLNNQCAYDSKPKPLHIKMIITFYFRLLQLKLMVILEKR